MLGPKTSVDAALLGPVYASDTRNTRYEKGTVKNRYGWRNFRAAQASFVASYGIHDLLGLSSAGVASREHVSFEDIGGTVKPYSRSVSTGAPTAITDGASALSLHASQWRKVMWEDVAYFFNANDASYRLAEHTVGTNNSFTAIKPPDPPDPSTEALTVAFVKNVLTGSEVSYREIDLSGVANGDVSVSGGASTGSSVDNTGANVNVLLGANVSGTLVITITLDGATGPGLQDLTYNDRLWGMIGTNIAGPAAGGVKLDVTATKISLINSDGSPVTFDLSTKAGIQSGTISYIADFAPGVLRSLKDNIKKIVVTLSVTSTSSTGANNQITIIAPTLGCINPDTLPTDMNAAIDLRHAYKNSTTGQESGIGPLLRLYRFQWLGETRSVPGIGNFPMGTFIKVTAIADATSGVDRWVLYSYYDLLGNGSTIEDFRVEGEFADSGSTLSQYIYRSVSEQSALAKHLDTTSPRIDSANIKCACVHNGSMAWGFKGGTANVKLSYVGQPLRLFTEYDSQTPDDVIGADLTMAPDLTDEPEALHSAGGLLVMLGSRGCYHSYGQRPILQQTTKKVPESQGVAGVNASCDWRDDSGVPGVAWLSSNLDTVWFLRVADPYNPEIVELSIDERTKIKAWLFGSSAPTTERIYVGVDPRSDALWVRYQNKAAVFRRANLVDGRRPWEFYDYTVTGTMYDCFFSDLYGMRSMRSTGEIDEVEYDSSSSFAAIEGTSRDGGAVMPSSFWSTKRVTGPMRRVVRFRCDRDSLTDRPTVTPTIDGSAQTGVQFASGSEWLNFPPTYIGRDWVFKIELPEGSGELRALEWMEAEVDPRYAS